MKKGIVLILTFVLAFTSVAAQSLTESDTTKWAIINVSCCNLRATGDYDAGMESQALLGMPARIIEVGRWMKIETPDEYPAWVLKSSLVVVNKKQLEAWNQAPQVVVTSIYGFVYEKPSTLSQHVSDVVASNRLKLLGQTKAFYKVEYPDGRQGYISMKDAKKVTEWRKSLKRDAASIIATGMKLNGVPYMWGGMSTKGLDCSGFIRAILFQHDIIIPRNASQQAKKGLHLDIKPDFSNLIPGDLVFFGRKATEDKPAHVSHVGMYIGNKKFIHSLGWVHVSSFNPADPEYDEYDYNRLLWAQRVLPYINKEEGLTTTDKNEFYK